MSTITSNLHSSLDPENQDQRGLLVRKNKERTRRHGEPGDKGVKGNAGFPGYKVKKGWSVLKVHLAQLAHRVFLGYKEKLVKEETWGKKVNWVTKASKGNPGFPGYKLQG